MTKPTGEPALNKIIERSDNADGIVSFMVSIMDLLTDDQRLKVFSEFCGSCGSTDRSCQCWNDE